MRHPRMLRCDGNNNQPVDVADVTAVMPIRPCTAGQIEERGTSMTISSGSVAVAGERSAMRRGGARGWRREVGTGTSLLVSGLAGASIAAVGLAPAASAAPAGPSFHILSAQDLCNLVWPTSQAMPDPGQPVGTVCVRPGGILERLSKAFPAFVSSSFKLEPGAAVQLPVGSVRTDPSNPMSDWLIPDCSTPGRIDCSI